MTANDSEWKTKYLSNLDRLEKMEQRWGEVEELLRMGITRVALAAQGVDSRLDGQLNSLRKSIRAGKNYEGLGAIVEDISTSVKRIDDLRQEDTAEENHPTALLLRLLNSLTFPSALKSRVKRLRKNLKKAGDDPHLETFLRELATLINDALNENTQEKPENKKGLLNRLFDFGAESDTSDTHLAPNNHEINASQATASDPTKNTVSESEVGSSHGHTGQVTVDLLSLLIDGLDHSSLDLNSQRQQLSQAQDAQALRVITQAIVSQLNAAMAATPADQISSIEVDAKQKQTETNAQQQNNQTIALGANLLQQIMAALNLAQHQPQQANAISTKISSAKNQQELESLCKDIAALTTQVLQQRTTETTDDADSPAENNICHFALQLLDCLNFPVEMQTQVTDLRDQLISGSDILDTPHILHGIADLVTLTRSRLEQEKQDLQDFLHQLTENLHDIDQQIAGAESQHAAAVVNNEAFGNTFDEHVKDIRSSLEDISDPTQLKLIIRERIDAIRDHVVNYRGSEIQRHKQLEEELTKTNTRLKELEKESQQLRQRLIEEHSQAIHDPLTCMYNRLAYEERIAQEYSRWRRYQAPLSLLVFDVDHFKRINDTYGHKAGDKALKLIAKCLQNNVRESDFIARFGGEEFVAIMPQTAIADAMEAANKLRQAVEKNQFHYDGKHVKITISCGVTQFRENDSIDSTFQRADQSLYICKQQGRNCCHTDDY